MYFIYHGKKSNYLQEIMESINEKHTEEEIIEKMGTEPAFRDQYKNKLLLIFNRYVDSVYQNIYFVLEKKMNGDFLLTKKWLTQAHQNLDKNGEKVNFKEFYKQTKKISEIIAEKPSNIHENHHIFYFKFTQGTIKINNKSFNEIQKINQDYNVNFNSSMQHLILIKMFIGNTEQENKIARQIIKQRKDKKFPSGNTDAIMFFLGADIFLINQKKQLNIDIFSRIKKYENMMAFNRKNCVSYVDYHIINEGKKESYLNINTNNLPLEILAFVIDNQIKKTIILDPKRSLFIDNIKTVYYPDIIHEIQLISINKANEHYFEIKEIVDNLITAKKITFEIKRKFSDADIQKRNIKQSSNSFEDKQLLDALDHHNGKIVFEQDDRVIVIIQTDTFYQNIKLSNPEIKENSLESFLLSNLFLKIFGQSLKKHFER